MTKALVKIRLIRGVSELSASPTSTPDIPAMVKIFNFCEGTRLLLRIRSARMPARTKAVEGTM
jgi:hypothetical protein